MEQMAQAQNQICAALLLFVLSYSGEGRHFLPMKINSKIFSLGFVFSQGSVWIGLFVVCQ